MTKKPSVFISYSYEDRSAATKLARMLEAKGIPVWNSGKMLESGAKWEPELRSALESSTAFVLYVSPKYLDSDSAKFEAGAAVGRSMSDSRSIVIPVISPDLRPSDLPSELRGMKWIRASKNDDSHLVENVLRMISKRDPD